MAGFNPLNSITLPTQLLFSFGLGTAAAPALEPYVQSLQNEAWTLNPQARLRLNDYGMLIAQSYTGNIDSLAEAAQIGYDPAHVEAATYLASTVPDIAQSLFLWRLGVATQGDFENALRKHGIQAGWIPYLTQLFSVPLTAEQVAVMIQRSVIPNQGQLPGYAEPGSGKVPPFPQVNIDGYASAQAYGMSGPQLDALTRIIGLPASPDLAARMAFRGIIDYNDFLRAAAEGNTRVEWAPFLFDGFREIPTARDYVDARIRGWITDAEMYAGTARHGMSTADTDLLFKDYGRPMTHRQVFQALRRGGVYNGPIDKIDPAVLKSLQEGNTRPEWYNLENAYLESYPSYFVIRPLVQSGAITEARATELFMGMGWPADIAQAAPAAFAGSSSTTTTSYPTKAEGQLWTTTHNAYKNGEITSATVTTNLDVIGVSATDQAQVLKFWDAERATIRKQLSPTQIKKAYAGQVPNPATGAAWTLQDAITALLDRGYDQADAETLLAE